MNSMEQTGYRLAVLSNWIDRSPGYDECSEEAVLWRRVTKVAEESGEAISALGGYLGENPRKGVTHERGEVWEELLDVAVAALGAVEHMTGNKGDSMALLYAKVGQVCHRAGLGDPVDRVRGVV